MGGLIRSWISTVGLALVLIVPDGVQAQWRNAVQSKGSDVGA